MRITNLALLLSFLVPSCANSQTHIYIKGSLGNYWMGDLKGLLRESAAPPFKTTLMFPVSLQIETGLDITYFDSKLREYAIGGFMNYAVTRGKLDYTDYSGGSNVVLDLKRIVLGMKLSKNVRHNISVYGKIGLSISYLDVISEIFLNSGAKRDERFNFLAHGIVVEPGMQWHRQFRRLLFTVNAGYELNVNGKTEDPDGNWMVDQDEKPIRINWSGFRLGAAVGLLFPR